MKPKDFIIIYKINKDPSVKQDIAIDLEDCYEKYYGGKANLGSTDSLTDSKITGRKISLKTSFRDRVIHSVPASKDVLANAKENNVDYNIIGYKYNIYKNIKSLNGKLLKGKQTVVLLQFPLMEKENYKKIRNSGNSASNNLNKMYADIKNKKFYTSKDIEEINKSLNKIIDEINISSDRLKSYAYSSLNELKNKIKNQIIYNIFDSSYLNFVKHFTRNALTGSNIYNNIENYVKNFIIPNKFFSTTKSSERVIPFEISKKIKSNIASTIIFIMENRMQAYLGKSYRIEDKEEDSPMLYNGSMQYSEGEASLKTYFNY